MTAGPTPPALEGRRLLRATVGALAVAAMVLVLAVLPAEYGVDPTGAGRLLGLTRLAEGDEHGTGEGSPLGASSLAPRDLYVYAATWRLTETPLLSRTGHLTTAAGEVQVVVPVNLTNVTRLTATLGWGDDERGTAPDLFEISLTAPDGRRSELVQGENAQGGKGNLTVSLPWRPVPFPEESNGTVRFDNGTADTSGRGDWKVVIRLHRAGGTDAVPDHGNSWILTVAGESYHLDREKVEGRAAVDQVTLTLRPNQGLEYKFAMREGDRMTYRWLATGPLYFDFHGDPDGAVADEFTSYRETTSEGDEGSFTAPFDGRHGWYWQNRGSQSVTLTLETSGEYRILGLV